MAWGVGGTKCRHGGRRRGEKNRCGRGVGGGEQVKGVWCGWKADGSVRDKTGVSGKGREM